MMTWEEFYNAIKERIILLLKEKEIDESNLQIEKIISDVLKNAFVEEGIMKRKKLPYNISKECPGKNVLYREDSKIKLIK